MTTYSEMKENLSKKNTRYFKILQSEYFNILQLLSLPQIDHTILITESNWTASVIN